MLFYETNSQSQENWFNFNICYSVSAHKGYFKTMASMTGNLGQASVKVKHYILLFYMQMRFPGGSDGIPEWSSGFPYFLQFQSEFGNKEFVI